MPVTFRFFQGTSDSIEKKNFDFRDLNGEVPVLEDDGCDQGPHVDDEAEPGGNHLDPDGRHVCGDGVDWDVHLAGAVPVGQRHHDEQRREAEQRVEHRPGDDERIFKFLNKIC